MVIGIDDAAYIGAAAIAAGGSAYSANQANSTSAGNAYMANMTNMVMQAQNQDFNSAEAARTREFNSYEASMARDVQKDEAGKTRNFNANESALGRQFNAEQNFVAREFNAAEAQKNRDFQERLSNTSYQRAIGDMKAAGLNPMLAYSQGGAQGASGSAASISGASGPTASSSSPGISAASGGQASSGGWSGAKTPDVTRIPLEHLGGVMNSAMDLKLKEAQIERIGADTSLVKAQIPRTEKETEHITAQISNTKETLQLIREQIVKTGYEGNKAKFASYIEEYVNDAWKDMNELERRVQAGKASSFEADAALRKVQATLTKYGFNAAENESNWAAKSGMLNPVLGSVGSALGSASKISNIAR